MESVISVSYDRLVSARAQTVSWQAEGHSVAENCRIEDMTRPAVYKCAACYAQGERAALYDRKSPRMPRTVSGRDRARILAPSRISPPRKTVTGEGNTAVRDKGNSGHRWLDRARLFAWKGERACTDGDGTGAAATRRQAIMTTTGCAGIEDALPRTAGARLLVGHVLDWAVLRGPRGRRLTCCSHEPGRPRPPGFS